MRASIEIKYIRTYSIAQWLRNLIIENDPDEYLCDFFEIDNYFIENALKPQKDSILHRFINEKLEADFYYESRKWPDYEEWNQLTEKHLEYTIDEEKFEDIENEYKDEIETKIVKEVLPKIAEEVFFLLFNDREFLFHFNSIISSKIKTLLKDDYSNLLESDGVIKRVKYWPKWLQKAIFYRDKGLCCLCYKDVSGLLNTHGKIHLDHIIPLNEGGTNDTSNIQLLCEKCNLEKGTKIVDGKYLYFRPY